MSSSLPSPTLCIYPSFLTLTCVTLKQSNTLDLHLSDRTVLHIGYRQIICGTDALPASSSEVSGVAGALRGCDFNHNKKLTQVAARTSPPSKLSSSIQCTYPHRCHLSEHIHDSYQFPWQHHYKSSHCMHKCKHSSILKTEAARLMIHSIKQEGN